MSTVLQFPDIASYQAGISLAGAGAVCVKATEDGGSPADRYENPDYPRAIAAAAELGAVRAAYHFLRKDDVTAEADYAYAVIGPGIATMIDAEASAVTLDDILGFEQEYRARGGLLRQAYLPRWYWVTLGSPSLVPLAAAGIGLISSAYPASGYTDGGEGWVAYGGVSPDVWQFTDSGTFNGHQVDLNAFRGTAADYHAYLYGAAAPVPVPTVPKWSGRTFVFDPRTYPMHGGDVQMWQARMAARGWKIVADGSYGPASEETCRAFQSEFHTSPAPGLAVDGEAGIHTWTGAWAIPVTR